MNSKAQQPIYNNEEQQYLKILHKHKFQNIDQLVRVLFDADDSQIYHRNLTLPKNQINIKPKIEYKKTYKNILEDHGNRFENILQIKKAFRRKYYEEDIIRAHQSRKQTWKILTQAKFKINQNPGFYQTLKKTDYPQFYRKVIDADVKRTLEQKSQQNQLKLSNILRCLTKRNPFIGYCQGMNFIINFLIIMQFQEEECFWIAIQLFQSIIPKNYYTNMQGVAVDLKIIEEFLRLYRPEIYQKLQQLNLTVSIISLQWLVCICTTIFPFYILVILWDLIFLEGSTALLKAAILIIEQLKELLLVCTDLTDFLTMLEPFKKTLQFQQNSFLQKINVLYIDKVLLRVSREVFQCIMKPQKKQQTTKHTQILCNPKWPICHQQLQKNKTQQADQQIWVFKQEGPPKLIDNYLQLKVKRSKIFKEDDRLPSKKLNIGRIPHICSPQINELFQGTRTSIQLYDYDSASNSYQITVESLKKEVTLQFVENAKHMNQTFIFDKQRKLKH